MIANFTPEEIRRLQILNDYIAQTIDVAQRVNPFVQRGLWHTGYNPYQGYAAIPPQAVQPMLGVPGGLLHTAAQQYVPAIPGAFGVTDPQMFGAQAMINPYLRTGLLHTGFDPLTAIPGVVPTFGVNPWVDVVRAEACRRAVAATFGLPL